jgi:hypothetical protein
VDCGNARRSLLQLLWRLAEGTDGGAATAAPPLLRAAATRALVDVYGAHQARVEVTV